MAHLKNKEGALIVGLKQMSKFQQLAKTRVMTIISGKGVTKSQAVSIFTAIFLVQLQLALSSGIRKLSLGLCFSSWLTFYISREKLGTSVWSFDEDSFLIKLKIVPPYNNLFVGCNKVGDCTLLFHTTKHVIIAMQYTEMCCTNTTPTSIG